MSPLSDTLSGTALPDCPLPLARLTCRIEFLSGGSVSQRWGQTLRGGLGYALRDLFCAKGRLECGKCNLNTACPYCYLFESPVPPQTEVMRLYTHTPHPLIIEAHPKIPTQAVPGDSLDFSIVLIGQALAYFPFVARAIEELGRQGLGRDQVRFTLWHITDEFGHKCWTANGRVLTPTPVCLPISAGKSRSGVFLINFFTPLRLKVGGGLCKQPSLSDLVLSLTRRLFLLRYFHGDGSKEDLNSMFGPAAQAAVLTKQQLMWHDYSRFSTRKNVEIPIGGLTGWLCFEGNFGILEPLLRLGEYIHVGKNVIFGLGQITAEEQREVA